MKTIKSGTALLCILLSLSIVLPYLFTLVRGSSFALDNALYYQRYVQHKYATEALLNYGISFCCSNFDKLQENESDNKTIMLAVDNWTLPNNNTYKTIKGTIEVTPLDHTVHIQATLQNDKGSTYQIMCDVSKNGEEYTIQNWNHAHKKNKKTT